MKRHSQTSGFTLLELTCALFVITTAGFGALQLYNVGLERIMEIGELDVATETLRNEMEHTRLLPFDQLQDREGFTNPSPALDRLHEATVAIEVSEVSPSLKVVNVTLRWQSRHGRWITRSLATRVASQEARQ